MAGDAYIFVSTAGKLERLVQTPYDKEADLQELLADHPELLAGDQIDEEAPRRWLLVGREVGIADGEDAADRWSIDHIFIDQDAIPTFVEVKRSSDSRIRREVIGQLLEYVANAARYWPHNQLLSVATGTAAKKAKGIEESLRVLLGEQSAEATAFWSRADQNLREGKVRLLFVADEIPAELRRMAEFLNDQMTHTEVLAVEVRQYVGASGTSALVPFVKNVTEKAREVKADARKRHRWTEADFVAHLQRLPDPAARASAEKIYAALRSVAESVNYGTGRAPSFSPRIPSIGRGAPITLWANGSLSVNYGYIDGSEGAIERRRKLAEAFGPLVGDAGEDPSAARYPMYEAARWVPHADVLVRTLTALGATPQ